MPALERRLLPYPPLNRSLSRAPVDACAVGAVGGEDLLVHLPARRARPLLRRGSVGEQRERSEEHTSELQSRLHLVCRLLLEKKNHNVLAHILPAALLSAIVDTSVSHWAH